MLCFLGDSHVIFFSEDFIIVFSGARTGRISRMLSADISVLGKDVPSGSLGAGRRSCGSGSVSVFGLRIIERLLISVRNQFFGTIIGFTFTTFADVGFPDGAERRGRGVIP